MSQTELSVILPVYNGSRYLLGAIENILTQSHENTELIIVDDASTDNTAEIIASIQDERVRKLRHEKNQGLPKALNSGFAASKGEYLTWTSDDNLYAPNALETLANFLDAHTEVDFVYADYWEIDETGKVGVRKYLCPPDKLLETNCVGACFLYRRRVYQVIGDYDPAARLVEDWEYWLRVSQRFRMEHISEPLYYYRVHPQSLTSQRGVKHERWRKITRIKRDRFGWSWSRYWREMAEIDIDEAFACFQEGRYQAVVPLVMRGVGRNPTWLTNLGVTSIFLRSLARSFRSDTKP